MSAGINIKGLEAIVKRIVKVQKLQNKILRKALTKAAQPIRKAMKSNAPKRYGFLKKSITSKVKANVKKEQVSAKIGPSTKEYEYNGQKIVPQNYSHIIEYGSSDQPAQPFLRPTFDQTARKAEQEMTKEIISGLITTAVS